MVRIESYETLLSDADRILARGDFLTALELLDRAELAYKTVGSPKLTLEIDRKYNEVRRELIFAGLGEIRTKIDVAGPDQTEVDLNTLYRRFRIFIHKKLNAADQAVVTDSINELRELVKKKRKDDTRKTPNEVLEFSAVDAKVKDLSEKLDDARKNNTGWDPREPRGIDDMPMIQLGRALKELENLLAIPSSSLEENQLKKEIETAIKPAQKLQKDLESYFADLDKTEIDQFKIRAEASSINLRLQIHKKLTVSSINDVSTLDTLISELDNLVTEIEARKKSKPSRYTPEVLKELSKLYPNLNIAQLESAQDAYWESKKTEVEAEKQSRQARRNEIVPIVHPDVANFLNDMEVIESTPSDVMTLASDKLRNDFDEERGFYDRFEKLKAKLTPEDAAKIELKLVLFDYRVTKRMILATMTAYEVNEMPWADLFGTKNADVFTNRMEGRINRIVKVLESRVYLNVDPALITAIKTDYARVKVELWQRKKAFITEESLKKDIWWNEVGTITESGKDSGSARNIPNGRGAAFLITQEDFPEIISPSGEVSSDARIHARGEYQLNPELDNRPEKMPDFDNPMGPPVEVDLPTTTYGEIMRILDDIYANRIPEYHDFYKIMHDTSKREGIPDMVVAIAEKTPRLKGKINKEQAKRAFYLHTIFFNQSMLSKGSAQLSDNAYYANQFLEYGIKEVGERVNKYDPIRLTVLFGKYDVHRDSSKGATDKAANPDGKIYLFDLIDNFKESDMPHQDGLGGWIAKKLLPATKPGEELHVRQTMSEQLHRNHLDHDYGYLAEAPYIVIDKSQFDTYPILPMPLQLMIFEDPTATYAPLKAGSSEIKVKRWKSDKPGELGRPVTAADYINTDGKILYELIPWDKVVENSNIFAWYNNSGNINKLLNLIRAESSSEYKRTQISALRKDAKYGAIFIPKLGPEVIAGRYKAESVFDEFMTAYVQGESIVQLRSGKDLHGTGKALTEYVGALDPTNIEAIKVTLESGFGTKEARERLVKLTSEQIKNLGKYGK